MSIKSIMKSKGTKGALLGLLAAALVASSAGAYSGLPRGQTGQMSAFDAAVEEIKQLAHQDVKEDGTAIAEKLQALLVSADATQFTNDTFNSAEFSVTLSDYPTQMGNLIRSIAFEINNADAPYALKYFFLQYSGATTFFSDVEGFYGDKKEFQVFENPDGCFAFWLFSNAFQFIPYNENNTFTVYSADVYIARDNAFSKQTTVLPLKLVQGDTLQLTQQGDAIKGIVYDENNDPAIGQPGCAFNSSTLSFEMPNGNITGKTIGYDLPGLLLGLSDSDGNLRTLYIRKEDGKLLCSEYGGQIIFPRNNTLYALKDYFMNETMQEDAGDGINYIYSGSLDFRKILCAPLGVDQTADFEKMFSPKPADGDYEVTDIPLYVGPDYVSYVENRFASAGGSGSWDTSAVRFDKLDNLSAFTAVYGDTNSLDVEISLTPHFQETTLADALYGTQANALYQADVHTYRETTVNTYTDFRQLAIKRNLGKWSLMLPMLQDNYARNGSYSNWINDFAVYSNDVPTALASDSSNVTVGGSNGDDFAKDLLDFPGSVAGLSQDDYFIYMTHQGNDFDSDLDLSIPVNLDENIVSINFAGAATQAAWTNELSQIGS